jgi:hypothetical protein
MPNGTKTYLIEGEPVDVAEEDVDSFIGNFPGAVEASSFIVEGDTVDVETPDVEQFLSQFPDAQPTFGDEVKKKNESKIPSTSKTKLNPQEESGFSEWYTKTSNNLGLDTNPDSPQQLYDYRGYFKEFGNVDMQRGQHFTDTYKLPGHPTFSIESKYYTPGMENNIKVGRWEGEKYIQIGTGDEPSELPTTGSLPDPFQYEWEFDTQKIKENVEQASL